MAGAKINLKQLAQYMTDLFAHSEYVSQNAEVANQAFSELKDFIETQQESDTDEEMTVEDLFSTISKHEQDIEIVKDAIEELQEAVDDLRKFLGITNT